MSARHDSTQLDAAGASAGGRGAGGRFRAAMLDCFAALIDGIALPAVAATLLERIEAEVPGSRARLHDANAARSRTHAPCRVAPECALRATAQRAPGIGQVRDCSACHAQGRHRLVARLGDHVFTLDVRDARDLQAPLDGGGASLASDLETAIAMIGALARVGARESSAERDAVRALTRELHDSVAQQLGVISFVVSQIQQQMCRSERPEALVSDLRTLVTRLQRQVRELITSARLRHDGRSLQQALAGSVEEFSRRSNVVFELDNRVPDLRLAPDVELHVLQIVREALSNVVRHSHAHHARIELTEDAHGSLHIAVTDDGVGFTPASTEESHHGLNILRERAQAIGAHIDIANVEGQGGARVGLVVPGPGPKEEQTGGIHDAVAD